MISENDNFYAWLDGMLDPEEAAEVEARVAANPELTELASRHRALKQRLRAAFNPIVEHPIPERILPRAEKPRAPIGLVVAQHQRARLFTQPAQWLAMAASLAIGLFFGGWLRPESSPVRQDSGALYAAASLEQSLDRQLASEPATGAVRVGVTFRDKDGTICRSFNDQRVAGLACREGGRWQLQGLFNSEAPQAAGYRMAAGMDPRLADLIGSRMEGEPLGATQERSARDRGWR
ncbi:MAG TPA: hypothetical protein VF067_00250 [Sphingomicrobium sp.]